MQQYNRGPLKIHNKNQVTKLTVKAKFEGEGYYFTKYFTYIDV
jgi:hypothetical protein